MLIWIWKERSATPSFYLLTFKLTAFFFPLPPSLSWCISPTKKFHSPTPNSENSSVTFTTTALYSFTDESYFALSHLSAHRNFDTRLLNHENSEVAYCRWFRFSLINNVWSCFLMLRTESLSIFSQVFFGEATERDANFMSKGHEGVFIILGLRS